MVRTQLYLQKALHARLRKLASKQGRTVSDLVREALDRVYGESTANEQIKTLNGIFGLWQDHPAFGTTDAYVRRLRRSTHRPHAS